MLTRRSLLLGGAAGLVACVRPKAKGFSGYAFVANQEGGAVAAVDLEVFAVARHIHVDGAPTAVVARPHYGRVYALTPENGLVHEIRTGNLTLAQSPRGSLGHDHAPFGLHALRIVPRAKAIGGAGAGSVAGRVDPRPAGRPSGNGNLA